MIAYFKLWDFLKRKGMKKTDLLAVTTSTTIARLGKNQEVSSLTLDKICSFLDCQPGDIMEYMKED